MAKFVEMKDGRRINVALIGHLRMTDDWWVGSDLQGQPLGKLYLDFDPDFDLAEVIPAAPGTTCLVIYDRSDIDATEATDADVWHEIHPSSAGAVRGRSRIR